MKKTLRLLCLASMTGFWLNSTAQTWWPQNSSTNQNLMNINFYDNNNGMSFGDTLTTIVSTTNKGFNWNGLTPTYTSGDIRSSAYLNNTTIVAVGIHNVVGGNGVVLKTSNNGSTWSSDISVPEKLFDVSFSNSTDGWISGENGYIARTTNAGTSWVQQNSGTGQDLFSIYFIDNSTGWAVGTVGVNATILKTTNAGSTWTAQNSGIVNDLLSVFFIDNMTGWAVGISGSILKTTDGGTNWVQQTSGTNEDLLDLYFLDANNGWIVGTAGTVLKTTDGGTNWIAETSGTGQDIQSIVMLNDSLGWFCGDGGTIHVYGTSAPNSISENAFSNSGIRIFPNPTNNVLNVSFTQPMKLGQIELFNAQGAKVMQADATQVNEVNLSVKDLLPGIYFLNILNQNGMQQIKPVVIE